MRKKVRTRVAKVKGSVVVETRDLLTIQSSHKVWKVPTSKLPKLDGSLVRLQPPFDATDDVIARVKSAFRQAGARKVRALNREPSPEVLNRSEVTRVEVETVREAVANMVSESFSERKEDLLRLIESFLDKAEARIERVQRGNFVEVGYITGIRLCNWMRFAGEMEISLEAGVYSVIAELDVDPLRSNWLGKSSFLNAIVFALTGTYPTSTADGWIHYGENEGGVDVEFSEELFISRWKVRGQGTQLEVRYDGNTYTGSDAQRFIDESVIDASTLFDTRVLSQKKTSQYIDGMGAAERSNVVNSWLGIDWVVTAADSCLKALSALSVKDEGFLKELDEVEEVLGEDSELSLRVTVSEEKRLERKLETVDAELQALFRAQSILSTKSEVERYERLQAELKSFEGSEEDAGEEKLFEIAKQAREKHAELFFAKSEVSKARKVAKGKFDGRCPVADITCPARMQINTLGEEAGKRLRACLRQVEVIEESLVIIEKDQERERSKVKAAEKRRARVEFLNSEMRKIPIERLRKQLKGKRKGVDEKKEVRLKEERRELSQSLSEAVRRREAIEEARDRKTSLQAGREAIAGDLELHRQAMKILGRNGVQRRVAESCLSQIESCANKAFSMLSVDLQLSVSWARETKQLADSCEECGALFPASTKVKQCVRCGARRGRKLSNKLQIELSDNSGGADDFGGFMFKLAAAYWLRQYSGSGWGIFLIDEPFGYFDQAHVRSFSTHLLRLLTEHFGVTQAFVVAHHADILESLPGRVLIKAEGKRSTVEVVGG